MIVTTIKGFLMLAPLRLYVAQASPETLSAPVWQVTRSSPNTHRKG